MKKTTFTFIILSAAASFFNYATYPALSRILNVNQFVDITVALALFTQLSSFTLTIVAITIGLSKQNGPELNSTIEKLQAVLAHMFLGVILIFLILSPLFMKKIHLPASMLLPICAMLALSISMSVITGYLNGKQKLVKLGTAIMLSAVLQFLLCIIVGIITKNGALALDAMALGSLISIIFIYIFYKDENMPRLSTIFIHRLDLYRSKPMRALITFTVWASLAAIATNILMIFDLLLVNNRQVDAQAYTDLYVVSRIVFFGGMLFVWPFLSNIHVGQPKHNIDLLKRLTSLFITISVSASVVMALFGNQVVELLLGSGHQASIDIRWLAIMSIIYKFIYLMITALTLSFIVMRNYWAIWLPLILVVLTGVLNTFIGGHTSTFMFVTSLNAVSLVGLIFGLFGYYSAAKHY